MTEAPRVKLERPDGLLKAMWKLYRMHRRAKKLARYHDGDFGDA